MDDKKFEELVRQYYNVRRNINGAVDKRIKDPDNDSHPVIIVDALPKKINCRDCNKELESGERRRFVVKNGAWMEACVTCRKYREPGSQLMMFLAEFPKTSAERAIKPEPEVIPEDELPELPQLMPEVQLSTTETVTIVRHSDGSVEQVIERDCHEFLIREYSRTPACPQTAQCDAPELDNEAHIDSHERQD